jgi:hypothetical protein
MPCHKSNLKDRVNRLLCLVVKRGSPSSQRRSLADEIQPKVITTPVAGFFTVCAIYKVFAVGFLCVRRLQLASVLEDSQTEVCTMPFENIQTVNCSA